MQIRQARNFYFATTDEENLKSSRITKQIGAQANELLVLNKGIINSQQTNPFKPFLAKPISIQCMQTSHNYSELLRQTRIRSKYHCTCLLNTEK